MTINVLISCANELIGQSVENLCKTQPDLDVINAHFLAQSDWTHLFERFQPDVFIVDEFEGGLILDNPIRPVDLLERFPDLRIITVSEQANLLHIYQQKRVLVSQVSDLFSAVRDQEENC